MTTSESSELAPRPTVVSNVSAPMNQQLVNSLPEELGATVPSSVIFLIICSAVVLTTLAYGTVHYWALAVFQLGAAIIVTSWVVDSWRAGSIRFSRSLLQLPMLALVVLGVVQLLPFGTHSAGAGIGGAARTLSLDPYSTRFVVIQLIALLVYFAGTLTFVSNPRRLRVIVYVIMVFGFVLAFMAIIQSFISPTKIYGILEPRFAVPFGPFVNRHNFAGYMEMTIALPLGLLFSGSVDRDKRLLILTAIGLMGIALLMSQSRGGLVSLVAEIVFLVAVSGLGSIKSSISGAAHETAGPGVMLRVALAGGLLLMLVVGIVLIGAESSLSRSAETLSSNDPTSSRTTIWRVSLDVIRNHPLLGAGLGSFGVAYTQYDFKDGSGRPEQAHNDYLQVAADAGIVGILLGAAFLLILFRAGFERRTVNDRFRKGIATGALAGCFAVLVHSLFDFTLHTTSNALLFLVLCALATLGSRVEDEEAERARRGRRRSSTSARLKAVADPALHRLSTSVGNEDAG